MREFPVEFTVLIIAMSVLLSTFSFLISLYVAKTLGGRMKRELLVAEILGKYCEIREIVIRGKVCLGRVSSITRSRIPDSLQQDFMRASRDSNDVFVEAFKNVEMHKLSEVKSALHAIKGNLLRILEAIEFHLEISNNYSNRHW